MRQEGSVLSRGLFVFSELLGWRERGREKHGLTWSSERAWPSLGAGFCSRACASPVPASWHLDARCLCTCIFQCNCYQQGQSAFLDRGLPGEGAFGGMHVHPTWGSGVGLPV